MEDFHGIHNYAHTVYCDLTKYGSYEITKTCVNLSMTKYGSYEITKTCVNLSMTKFKQVQELPYTVEVG